jgi:hypothetical protein
LRVSLRQLFEFRINGSQLALEIVERPFRLLDLLSYRLFVSRWI